MRCELNVCSCRLQIFYATSLRALARSFSMILISSKYIYKRPQSWQFSKIDLVVLSNIVNSTTHRHRRREKGVVTLDVIELGEPKETDPMMLHHDVLNSDVTRHVTHEYQPQNFMEREKEMGIHKNVLGENHYTHDYHDTAHKYFIKGKDRHSTDVDDGVISSDGDYDTARQNLESLEADIEVAPTCDNKDQSSDLRLSHAESTDSGMGFSDNAKDGEASRLSANDGYGHFIKPLQEDQENRKSLIDGDAEYDEVMEFISTPTEDDNQRVTRQEKPTFSTFQTPRKSDQGDTSPGDANPKYAKVDIAKILHTRRRHQHSSTLRRQAEEEKVPEDGYNSLRKKTKSKNYSISAYGTFRRNRKSSGQQNTDSWASRPSSACNENEDVLSPLSDRMMMSPSTSFDRRSNHSALDIPYGHYHTLKTRRSNYSSDLMMTSNVNDDVMGSSATIDRRTSGRSKPKSPDAQNSFSDMNNDTNRWSWLSNSSNTQSQTNEKPPTGSKNPWKIFRRLLGGGDSKQKIMDGTMSSASLSTRSRPSSLFRRFSSKKTNKNPLNKRRNSVPTKSEWDVHAHDDDTSNFAIHIPVMDAGKQRPVAPKALSQKSRSRLSTRLMSFRGGKNRNSTRLNDDPMSKGLSISSPQLAVNAIDPTRNYSEHQLLNLKDLSINPGRK